MSLHWYKHNIGDYSKDTRGMTYEQQGLYVALRDISWDQEPSGTLPNDDTELARLLSLPEKRWIGHRPVVLKLWKGPGKRLTHAALYQQGEQAKQKSELAKRGPHIREMRKRTLSNAHRTIIYPRSEIRNPRLKRKEREEPASLRSAESASIYPVTGEADQEGTGASSTFEPTRKDADTSTAHNNGTPTPNKKKRLRRDLTETYVDMRFEAFWAAYPNKTLKGDAEKAWQRLQTD